MPRPRPRFARRAPARRAAEALGMGLLCACGPAVAPAPGPPVVALITLDTWRLDHFSPAHTPALWALGEEGEVYTEAWSPIGLTTPAHLSMWTGLLPWEHGVEGNNHHGYELPPSVLMLTEEPVFAGFAKGAFVSAFPAGPDGGLSRGFEVFDGPASGERPGEVAVARALAWLPEDRPALLWVHLYEPHGPYLGEGATDPERYAEEVARADAALAPLLEALRARGARVVVAADHGEVLLEERCGRQHERSVHDAVLRVPLLRWEPGRGPAQISGIRGLTDVPALLRGQDPPARPHWLAEAGVCEAGCSPGCAPAGLGGRDRIAVAAEGRWLLRGGRLQAQGRPPAGLDHLVMEIPAVPVPGAARADEARLLGYTE
jgi:hypothetical protein